MSVNSTSPESLFGGTWTQIKDVFLLACGNTYSNGTTGGEATHKLTIQEMPNHNHSANGFIYNSVDNPFTINQNGSSKLSTATGKVGVDYIGGNQAHNNMPPYLGVYMWKRTA